MGRKTKKRRNQKTGAKGGRPRGNRMVIAFSMVVAGGAMAALVSLMYVFCYDFLTQTNYLRADTIAIQGAHRLSRKEILGSAQIHTGMNVLSINLSAVRKRLLSHPWIAQARVSRQLPGTITIGIKEHKPLAVLDLDRKFMINTDGEIFKEWVKGDPKRLPRVKGLRFSEIYLPGEAKSDVFRAVMEVLHLGQAPKSVLSNRMIETIQVDQEMGLTLHAVNQVKIVKLGYRDYAGKYKRLQHILSLLKQGGKFSDVRSIDLNDLDRIVVNPIPKEV